MSRMPLGRLRNVAGTRAMSPKVSPPKVQNSALSVIVARSSASRRERSDLNVPDAFGALKKRRRHQGDVTEGQPTESAEQRLVGDRGEVLGEPAVVVEFRSEE